jgi:hypothetical protein
MIEADLAMKLRARLQQVPNPTLTMLLAEFKRPVAAEKAKVETKH